MGNRFSTLTQYHKIILAHAIMGVMVFLFLIPFSVMTARFYSRRPGWAIKYHAQMNILAGILLLAVFILGFFAVGQERSLTNPHHGIGVAIFVLFVVQIVGGRLIRKITKIRSLRITIHQWFGRTIALLGIVQVPLGLTLYGSPKFTFILYAVWMAFLLLLYFILSYRSEGRREFYMSGGRSEVTGTRVTESEYFASDRKTEATSGRSKLLGPLAAGAGIWALARGRKKNQDRNRSRSRSRSTSMTRSRGPEVIASRHGSSSYLTRDGHGEKYSDVTPQKKSGGGFMKILGGAAAVFGAGKLISGMTKGRNRDRDDEYSAVSTETPQRHRSGRAPTTMTDFTTTVMTEDTRPDRTATSLVPPSGQRPPRAPTISMVDSRLDSRLSSQAPPVTPLPRPSHGRASTRRSEFEESDYSSYVSPSRRPIEDRPKSGGFAKGVLGALGVGWFAKKMADRRTRREEDRYRDEEEDLRSGTSVSRFTGDGHPSPTRKPSHRPPPVRRATGWGRGTEMSSDLSSSVFEERPTRGNYVPPTEISSLGPSTLPPVTPLQPSAMNSGSRVRRDSGPVDMPAMPPDPQGFLATESLGSGISPGSRHPRDSARRQRAAEEAAAAVIAGRTYDQAGENRQRYDSPSMSVKLKVHDDKDRNVTLRRLTEEEAMAARGRRPDDTESSLSGIDSPTTYGRRRYRRDSSQRRAEVAAERKAEEDDQLPALSPPNPAFAKGKRAKDSAYYSGQPAPPAQPAQQGQPGPSGTNQIPMAIRTVSSFGSQLSPEGSRATWSGMSPSPPDKNNISAADNRRRRRAERRRPSETRPSGADMFD